MTDSWVSTGSVQVLLLPKPDSRVSTGSVQVLLTPKPDSRVSTGSIQVLYKLLPPGNYLRTAGSVRPVFMKWTDSSWIPVETIFSGLADIDYTTPGLNGLLSWCRANGVTYTASQISTYTEYVASRAADGILTLPNASHTDNSSNAWWGIDFGATHSVVISSMSIRGGVSTSHTSRYYVVEGSNDGSTWTVLYDTGGTPNPIAADTWVNLSTSANITAYRHIRFRHTNTTVQGTNYLYITEAEIYGVLR